MSEITTIGGWVVRGSAAVSAVRSVKLSNTAYGQWQGRRAKVRFPGPKPPEFLYPTAEWLGSKVAPPFVPGLDSMNLEGGANIMPHASTLVLKATLRDYQHKAILAWQSAGGDGVIVAPTGSGKTIMAIAAAARTETPALVLCHTRDLLRQWKKEVEALTGTKPAMFGGGVKQPPGRITLATVQTLAKLDDTALYQFLSKHGLLILDEAHHAPAKSWLKISSVAPVAYRLGVTATPIRKDGLGPWLNYSFGPQVATIGHAELEKSGHIVRPKLQFITSEWEPRPGESEWHVLQGDMATDTERNSLIVNIAMQMVEKGRTTLCLVARVRQAQELSFEMGRRGVVSDYLTSDVKDVRRTEILDKMKTGVPMVVFATSLADEGLDIPKLNGLILANPTGDIGKLMQRIGRVIRPVKGGMQPLVVDIVDRWGAAQGWARRRRNAYQKLEWL